MDTTEWLIAATVAAPVLTTLDAPGFIRAVDRLARAQAQRVKHVEVSGTDLYDQGVPMTEAQCREMYAAVSVPADLVGEQEPDPARGHDREGPVQDSSRAACEFPGGPLLEAPPAASQTG